MPIVSLAFLAFVLVVLGVFYLLPGRLQLWWLLVSSYAFYAVYSWHYVVILAVLTAVNFALAQPSMLGEERRRRSLGVAVAVNLSALAFFKIAEALATKGVQPGSFTGGGGLAERFALPIGLSFYVLQAISYQIDVRRGQAPANPDFVTFALYLAYFPKLLAGPIERARGFFVQLTTPKTLDDDRLCNAFTLIMIGLVRKSVIADPLATMIPRAVFTEPEKAPALAIWLIAYSFSLYNDFAGYTSIVRGVSALFGIDLAPNFLAPLFARSFSEFWNRWHMTLSFWLRDYVYMPLSRALLRRNPAIDNVANIVVPPMISMLASGLWHGTGWHMLLWGGLHGTFLVAERATRVWRPAKPIARRSIGYRAAAASGVFLAILFANVFFRMSIGTGMRFLAALVSGPPSRWIDPRPLVLITLALSIDWVQWRNHDELVFLRWPILARSALLAAALLALVIVAEADISAPFVYQGF